MKRIRHLNIEITRRCDQRCVYCFNDSGPAAPRESVTLDRWLRVLELLRREGLRSVHITGGEPFVWPDTIGLLAGAQDMGLETSILSNGYRIPDLARAHAELFRSLTVAQISLDSMTPDSHDSRRGKVGAWKQAIQAIEALRGLDASVEVSCTISQENAHEPRRVAVYCRSIGAKLLLRPMETIGRADSCQLIPLQGVTSKQILSHFDDIECDILVNDRFMYVPTGLMHDKAAWREGILTVNPTGSVRGDLPSQDVRQYSRMIKVLLDAA